MTTTTKIDESVLRIAAASGGVDRRTLDKVLAGKAVKGLAGERARAALVKLGIEVPEAPRWSPAKAKGRAR
jgi:hypothetical protein